MAVNERSYVAANGVLSFLSVLVWFLIVIGTFAFLIGLLNGGQMALVFAPSGLVTAIFGVIGLALVQIGRANVHSAEINWEMLVLARRSEQRDEVRSRSEKSDIQRVGVASNNSELNLARGNKPFEESLQTRGNDLSSTAISSEQYKGKDGNSYDVFVFSGGLTKVTVGGEVREFFSKQEAIDFLDYITKK